MAETYEVGVALGMGVAVGVILAGILAPRRYGFVAALVGVVVIGFVGGLLIRGWLDVPGGVIGGVIGASSAAVVVRGALRRGATMGGTAFILASAGVAIATVSLIPVVGYIVAIGAPIWSFRKVRSEPERYAGLRTLAK